MGEVIRTYAPGDEERVADLLRECFGTYRNYGLDGSKWLEYTRLNAGFRLEGAYLLEVGGRLVSHVQVVEKRLRTAAGTLAVAGIANVATHPDFRGRGYATRLLARAMEDYRARGFPLTALFTGFASGPQRIYRRLGYVDVCVHIYWSAPIDDALQRAQRVPWVEVREAEERDVDGVSRLYEAVGDRYTGWPVRARGEWVEKLVRRTAYHGFFYVGREPGNFVVAEEGGEPLGYAVLLRIPWEPEAVGIAEIVAEPGRGDAMLALYSYAVSRAAALGARVVRTYAPPTAEYRRAFRAFQPSSGGVFMSEVLDLRGLLAEAARGVRWAGEPLAVEFAYRGQRATLRLSGEGCSLADGEPHATVDLDPTTFNRLLFGHAEPVELLLNSTVRSGVRLGRVLEALEALFRPRPFHVWPVDQW